MKKLLVLIVAIILCMSLVVGCSSDDPADEVNNENQIGKETDNQGEEDKVEEDNSEVEDIEYVLFLKEKGYPNIVSQTMTIKNNDERLKTKTVKEIAVEHLISFGEFNGLISPIPSGTKLLGLEIDGNKAIVDLSNEFVKGMKKDEYNTMLSLAGVINTVAVFEDIDKVAFKIQGETIKNLNGIDMTKEFEYNMDFFTDK